MTVRCQQGWKALSGGWSQNIPAPDLFFPQSMPTPALDGWTVVGRWRTRVSGPGRRVTVYVVCAR
jgi:hypothetical protein